MHPDRVTALLDLFTRSPELSREVKGIWWSVGVEEYRVSYSSSPVESEAAAEGSRPASTYESFRWKSEEREVRKAQQRLELLNLLAKRGRWLRRLWVTGCETQRKWDSAGQSRRGSSRNAPIGIEEEEKMLMVNLAFPADVLKGCANLEELRLGEDVRVIASGGDLERGVFSEETKPSSEFSALTRNLNPKYLEIDGDLKEVALQVSDFAMLVDELSTESSSLLRLFDGRSFDRLSLTIDLPSSYTPRASIPNTPTNAVPPPLSAMNVTRPAPPLTVSDRVTKLLTFLTSHRTARTISVEFRASIEQGADILLNGIDLEPIARQLSSEPPTSGAFCRSSSIDVHFSLSPGCYTSYSYAESPDMNVEDFGEGLSKERVERSYRSVVDMLCGAGVKLEVGYDVVG
ncbi:hypothetical protein H1R20_g2120, partial [Candolleomyces eurysporus]